MILGFYQERYLCQIRDNRLEPPKSQKGAYAVSGRNGLNIQKTKTASGITQKVVTAQNRHLLSPQFVLERNTDSIRIEAINVHVPARYHSEPSLLCSVIVAIAHAPLRAP
jgi:hypothetical protein